jgi:RNA polymerase sigma-70 factor (ECF subfamily)
MKSDDELYRMYLSGDKSSYDELMLRYGDSLTYFLNGYLHNLQDAEDLMIESFARIMVKKPAIRPGCFKAYLYKTARNLATRFHGVKSRIEVFSLEGSDMEIGDFLSPEKKIQDGEHKKFLYQCLDRIDARLKEALWLVYLEKMSYAEAAKVMGVTTKRIDKLLQRGKEHLRKELKKEGITNAYE